MFWAAFVSWSDYHVLIPPGKPRGRQTKAAKHTVDSGGVINITDDSSSDTDGIDTDSNSSPDSLLDNDDVIFVNHTSFQTGVCVYGGVPLFFPQVMLSVGIMCESLSLSMNNMCV